MTAAPKIEVYNKLVCAEHRPEYSSTPNPYPTPAHPGMEDEGVDEIFPPGPVVPKPEEGEKGAVEMMWSRAVGSWKWEPEYAQTKPGPVAPPSALCRADPVVQAEVAKISTGAFDLMIPVSLRYHQLTGAQR